MTEASNRPLHVQFTGGPAPETLRVHDLTDGAELTNIFSLGLHTTADGLICWHIATGSVELDVTVEADVTYVQDVPIGETRELVQWEGKRLVRIVHAAQRFDGTHANMRWRIFDAVTGEPIPFATLEHLVLMREITEARLRVFLCDPPDLTPPCFSDDTPTETTTP